MIAGPDQAGASLAARVEAALNKLAKWRVLLVGWQLGTRSDSDPECLALRDQQDARLMMRVEISALLNVLRRKQLLDDDEFRQAVLEAAVELDQQFELAWPGFSTTATGLDMKFPEAGETMQRRHFKP